MNAKTHAVLLTLTLAVSGAVLLGLTPSGVAAPSPAEADTGVPATPAAQTLCPCKVGCNTIIGTDASETLVGTNGCDCIQGRGGDDTISGLGGDDMLCGGPGFDKIDGGDGHDLCDGERTVNCE